MAELTYAKAERMVTPDEISSWLDGVADLAETAGIEISGLDEGRELVARADRFVQEWHARRETRDSAFKRLSDQIVAGEIDLDTAAERALEAEQWSDSHSLLARAISLTEGRAARVALRDCGRRLDGDGVIEECRNAAAELVEEISALRPVIGDVRDSDQATIAGSEVASAWAQYKMELLPRWVAVHRLARELRKQHWIHPLPEEVGPAAGASGYANWVKRGEDWKQAKRAGRPIADVLDPICDTWVPGGPFTEEEALENLRTYAPEPDPEEAERQQKRDQMLTTTSVPTSIQRPL